MADSKDSRERKDSFEKRGGQQMVQGVERLPRPASGAVTRMSALHAEPVTAELDPGPAVRML